jgi:histidinol-phosphatase
MPPVAALADDLSLALELADVADAITLSRFRAADLVVETKPDLTPVSEADRAVERALRERLAQARPEDSVLGEEYGDSSAPAGARRWIVDPIDGTKNYVRGAPVWGTLIGLEQDGEIVAGVVSAPALARRWWATRGGGAFAQDGLDDEPRRLRVSAIAELDAAQLCLYEVEAWEKLGRLDSVIELATRCWRSGGFGDFWGYMLVAEGVAEISLDPSVSVWDLAALKVIVEEAGGRFTDLGGVATIEGGDSLATNGRVHEAALSFVGR